MKTKEGNFSDLFFLPGAEELVGNSTYLKQGLIVSMWFYTKSGGSKLSSGFFGP